MSIGPAVLGQCAEALRRIRNSARFILGNVGTGLAQNDVIGRERLGLVGIARKAFLVITTTNFLSIGGTICNARALQAGVCRQGRIWDI
jgi:hypothetical protein